jgi:hypothetical protein
MDVSEPGRDAKVGRDLDKCLVDLPDVLGLGVEGVVVDILVVDTILLAASDANLHLEPLLPGGGTLEVLGRGLDIVLNILLRKIDHMAAEEGNTGLLEEGLVGVHHPVEPGKKLLGATSWNCQTIDQSKEAEAGHLLIAVEDDRDYRRWSCQLPIRAEADRTSGNRHTAIHWGDGPDVVGCGDSASNGSLLAVIGDALSGKESSTTIRNLQDQGSLCGLGCLEGCYNSGRGGNIDGREGEARLAGELEELLWWWCVFSNRAWRTSVFCVIVHTYLENIVTVQDTGLEAQLLHEAGHCGMVMG